MPRGQGSRLAHGETLIFQRIARTAFVWLTSLPPRPARSEVKQAPYPRQVLRRIDA